jgi:multiple sugar transport system ATP-binding protein
VPGKGETIWVTIRPNEQHVFSASTQQRLTPHAVKTASSGAIKA